MVKKFFLFLQVVNPATTKIANSKAFYSLKMLLLFFYSFLWYMEVVSEMFLNFADGTNFLIKCSMKKKVKLI